MSAPARAARVAVSGAAGTGKSTLARALAETLAVPYLDEGMRRRLEQGLDPHRLGREGQRALADELLDEMIERTDEALRRHGGFVSDRSPLDLAAFWIYYGFGFDEARTDAYVARARAAAQRLDLVVVAPLGVFALEADGVRTANPWIQRHYAAVLEMFLAASPRAVLRLPATAMPVEQRVRHVTDALARSRAAAMPSEPSL